MGKKEEDLTMSEPTQAAQEATKQCCSSHECVLHKVQVSGQWIQYGDMSCETVGLQLK